MAPSAIKQYYSGTHRTIAPAETIERWRPLASSMEITRIANVTGLDFLGVPVVLAMRPNSRSLSVAQGKGLDLASATASALMEAAETFHAETVLPDIRSASIDELASSERTADCDRLPRTTIGMFTARTAIPWSRAHSLIDGGACLVPFDLVHLDYSHPPTANGGYFPLSSTGLASGNTLIEALCSGLYELIERDATTLWTHRQSTEKATRRLDLDTVDTIEAQALIASLLGKGMSLSIWNATSDIGIPVFICQLAGTGESEDPLLYPFAGAGCHLDSGVALLRAITEAVQSRLTYISGSRDDLLRHDYVSSPTEMLLTIVRDAWERLSTPSDFRAIPTIVNASFAADLELIKQRLAGAGLGEIYAVDLTRSEFELPVTRVIVPGLEFDDDDPNGVPGQRLLHLKREAS